jgi:hypothetical protein
MIYIKLFAWEINQATKDFIDEKKYGKKKSQPLANEKDAKENQDDKMLEIIKMVQDNS